MILRPGFILLASIAVLGGCAPEKQQELKAGEKALILTGTVAPIQRAEVTSTVSAIVSEVLVVEGKRVAAGEVVVRLDPTTYRADVQKAEASLSIARANLVQARAGTLQAQIAETRAEVERLRQELERERRLSALPATASDYEEAGIILENAKARLERMYSLFARRLASKPELEGAQNEYAEAQRRFEVANEAYERRTAGGDSELRIAEARHDAARARLRGLEVTSRTGRVEPALAQVSQAEADLANARYNLAHTTVQAPIGGIVTEVKSQPGEKIYERSPLVTIEEINRVQIRADLSPGLLRYVRVGQPAQVTVNTVPPTTVASTIHGVLPVADPKTQSLGITLILLNPDLKFQPGYTARVEIPVERTPPAPAKKS